MFFFFCKQKTAYEMRISDWSSDVCSSDLMAMESSVEAVDMSALDPAKIVALDIVSAEVRRNFRDYCARWATQPPFYIMHDGILQVMVGRHRDLTEVSMDSTIYSVELPDRKSVVSGKSVSVCVVLGVRRTIKKK